MYLLFSHFYSYNICFKYKTFMGIYITPTKLSGKSLFEVLPASHVDSTIHFLICGQLCLYFYSHSVWNAWLLMIITANLGVVMLVNYQHQICFRLFSQLLCKLFCPKMGKGGLGTKGDTKVEESRINGKKVVTNYSLGGLMMER